MSAPRRSALFAAAACLPAAFCLSLCVGRYPLTLPSVLASLAGSTDMAAQVFWRLRLPRAFAAMLAGAALGTSGAAYQAVFSNPLAAPDIMGVSGGATLGAAAAIVFFGGAGETALAFAGGLAALLLALLLTRASGARGAVRMRGAPHARGLSGTSTASAPSDARGTAAIVLSGVLVSALVRAALTVLKLLADTDGELAAIEFFTMGSFSGITVRALPPMLAGVLPGLIVLALLRRQISLLTLAPEEAASLGVNVGAMRALVLGAATLGVCAISAQTGVIAFAPLIAPHGARLLLGGRSRGRLALSALLGAVLLLLADTAARLVPGAELPVSVFTTALGVPMLISLMRRGGRSDA